VARLGAVWIQRLAYDILFQALDTHPLHIKCLVVDESQDDVGAPAEVASDQLEVPCPLRRSVPV
jgi:hypothetical protein